MTARPLSRLDARPAPSSSTGEYRLCGGFSRSFAAARKQEKIAADARGAAQQ
jgi:hypothetical protein